jgi:hypothetical protein
VANIFVDTPQNCGSPKPSKTGDTETLAHRAEWTHPLADIFTMMNAAVRRDRVAAPGSCIARHLMPAWCAPSADRPAS